MCIRDRHDLVNPNVRVVWRTDDAGSTKLRATPEDQSEFAVDDVDGEETNVQDGDLVIAVRTVRLFSRTMFVSTEFRARCCRVE